MTTIPPTLNPDPPKLAAMKAKQAPFVERMRIAMKANDKMRQTALAEATGIRQSIVSRHLAGLCEPMPDAMKKYAEVLGVNAPWLWLGAGPMRGTPDSDPNTQQAAPPVDATVAAAPLSPDAASITQSMSLASGQHLRTMAMICKIIPLVPESDLPDFTRTIIDSVLQTDVCLVLAPKTLAATPHIEPITADEVQLLRSYESATDNMRLAAHVIAGCAPTKEPNQGKKFLLHYRNIDLSGKARLSSILTIDNNGEKQQKHQ
jgi:hypothetical protein